MKKQKKPRWKKLLIWLLVDVVVAVIIFALLLHKPSRYNPVVPAEADPNGQRVHPYLHRELASTLYNGAQSRRPFEMVVVDRALNEAIARAKWPQESGGIVFSAPEVLFVPGQIVLMGTANIEGADLVVTIELTPQMDERGYLNLIVDKVKLGAVNITPLARMVARKMYQEGFAAGPVDTEDWRTKIAASLLSEKPFEPVFSVDDKWVRLKGFDVTAGTLSAEFVPAK